MVVDNVPVNEMIVVCLFRVPVDIPHPDRHTLPGIFHPQLCPVHCQEPATSTAQCEYTPSMAEASPCDADIVLLFYRYSPCLGM